MEHQTRLRIGLAEPRVTAEVERAARALCRETCRGAERGGCCAAKCIATGGLLDERAKAARRILKAAATEEGGGDGDST